MAFELRNFEDPRLDVEYVTHLVDQQAAESALRFDRLWDYFRNPLLPAIGPAADALNATGCSIASRMT